MSITINGKPVNDVAVDSGSVETVLLEVCYLGSETDSGDSYVRYPSKTPAQWLENGKVTTGTFASAKVNGWKDVAIDNNHFLVPPDKILGQLLTSMDYGLLLAAGVAKIDGITAPPTPDLWIRSPLEDVQYRLYNICTETSAIGISGRDIFFPPALNTYSNNGTINEVSVSNAVRDGWTLILTDGTYFMLPPNALAFASGPETGSTETVNAADLLALNESGIIQMRYSAESLLNQTPTAIDTAKKDQGQKTVAALDLELFQLTQMERWETDHTVVDLTNYDWLERVPSLKKWLEARLDMVEPSDLTRLENFIFSAQKSGSIRASDIISVHMISGVLGEIIARRNIVDEYKRIVATRPNAFLAVAPQICSGDSNEASDAVVGEVVYVDGEPSFRIYAVWELTIGSQIIPTAERQMRRTLEERFPKHGILLVDAEGNGANLPVILSVEETSLFVQLIDLDQDTATTLSDTAAQLATNLEDGSFVTQRKSFRHRSEQQLLEDLKTKAKALGRSPSSNEIDADNEMASSETYRKKFGSFNKALEAAGLTTRKVGELISKPTRTRQQLIDELRAFGEKIGHPPSAKETKKEPGMASSSTYISEFGNWNAALEAAGFSKRPVGSSIKVPFKSSDQMLAELRALAKRLGHVPTYDEVDKEPGMAAAPTYESRFGGLSNAQILAGLTANRVSKPREEMAADLKKLAARLGRSPTQPEVDAEPNMASSGSYADEFGTFNKALEAAGLETRIPGSTLASPIRTETELLDGLRRLGARLGKTPEPKDIDKDPELPVSETFKNRFGSIQIALERAGFDQAGNLPMQTSELLEQPSVIPFEFSELARFIIRGLDGISIFAGIVTYITDPEKTDTRAATLLGSLVELLSLEMGQLAADAGVYTAQDQKILAGAKAQVERSRQLILSSPDGADAKAILTGLAELRFPNITTRFDTGLASNLLGGNTVDAAWGGAAEPTLQPFADYHPSAKLDIVDVSETAIYKAITRARILLERVEKKTETK